MRTSGHTGAFAPAPRTAVLRWPNGATSIGRLVGAELSRPAFLASEVAGPFADRCEKAGGAQAIAGGPGEIAVRVTATSYYGDLAHVQPALLHAVPGIHPGQLEDLADVAGSGRGRLSTNDDITLSHVMRSVLRHIESDCSDRFALRRAMEALERPYMQFDMVPVEGSGGHRCRALLCDGPGADEADPAAMVHELDEGAHLFLRAKLGAPDAMRHMIGISVTRASAEHVQVNLINGNGWYELTGKPGFERMPAMGKLLPIGLASAGLASLLDEVIERPARAFRSERGRQVWDASPSGAPLTVWLRELDPRTPLQPTGHRMTPQKGSECTIEMSFAWLATVLPQGDYKLAKANVLQVLRQAAEANDLDQEVLQRLDERITSSLSGHAMALGGGS